MVLFDFHLLITLKWEKPVEITDKLESYCSKWNEVYRNFVPAHRPRWGQSLEMPLENHHAFGAPTGFYWSSRQHEPTGAGRHLPKQLSRMQMTLLDSSVYRQLSEMGFQTWICISSARICNTMGLHKNLANIPVCHPQSDTTQHKDNIHANRGR